MLSASTVERRGSVEGRLRRGWERVVERP